MQCSSLGTETRPPTPIGQANRDILWGAEVLWPGGSLIALTTFINRFLPDLYLPRFIDLDPAWLVARGIRGLITDLDNTMVAWRTGYPDDAVVRLFEELKAMGIACCILSNAPAWRVRKAAQLLDIPAVANAHKPRRAGFFRALKAMGRTAAETCAIGDQIFTDIWGANRAGLTAILVVPFGRREFVWTRLVRHAERAVLRSLARRGLLQLAGTRPSDQKPR
jgi:HAD superfamily phosphatase (TIGR01668 family)